MHFRVQARRYKSKVTVPSEDTDQPGMTPQVAMDAGCNAVAVWKERSPDQSRIGAQRYPATTVTVDYKMCFRKNYAEAWYDCRVQPPDGG